MQYLFIHAVEEGVDLSPDVVASLEQSLATWVDQAIALRVNLHGNRLCPASDATTVRLRAGDVCVTDGPFVETKEQVAGYDLMVCPTMDDAVRWASLHPTARIGSIEVRPLTASLPLEPLPQQKPGTNRYFMFVCWPEGLQLEPEESAAMGPAMDAWLSEVDGQARLVGQQIEGPASAKTVRVRDERVLVTDGPFAETKEMIAGFDILDCTDLDEALDVAAKHPVARYGALELRPFWTPA